MKLIRLSLSVYVNPEHVAYVDSYTVKSTGEVRTTIHFRALERFEGDKYPKLVPYVTVPLGRSEVVRH